MAKSLLINSILNGYPIPIIFIRERSKATDIEPHREVVDGQQRLRTIISFVQPSLLRDPRPGDQFELSKKHFPNDAGKSFRQLSREQRDTILSYQISTHVLPPSASDRLVLQIFARLNSTGTQLTNQELRNAEFFGQFRRLSYDLAYEHLEHWRKWGIYSEQQIARMDEVEMTSDLLGFTYLGTKGKSKKSLDDLYKEYDDNAPYEAEVRKRFRATMEEIDHNFGDRMSEMEYSRSAMFFTLFCAVHELVFEFPDTLSKRITARQLKGSNVAGLKQANTEIATGRVPRKYADAFERATADLGRRERRLEFLLDRAE